MGPKLVPEPDRPPRRLLGSVAVWLRATGALIMILAVAGAVPWLLVVTVGNPIPAEGWSWSQPLTNEALLGLIAVLAWLFWAQMMACLAVEITAELRIAAGRSADWLTQIPGTFGGQQQLARLLVHAVVAVGIGATATATATTADVAAATPVDHEPQTTGHLPAAATLASLHTGTHGGHTEVTRHTRAANMSQRDRQATITVEVRKGDTLWSIAERHLGSGEQWRRIAEANENRVMPDGERFTRAASIRPGWLLLVPTPSTPAAGTRPGTVAVEAGDTLWSLAEQAYGDGQDWTRLYDANRAQVTDPDLINPGQVLNVPERGLSSTGRATGPQKPDTGAPGKAVTGSNLPDAAQRSVPVPTEAASGPGRAESAGRGTALPRPDRTPEAPSVDAADFADSADDPGQADHGHQGGDAGPALVGGGALLAGGALAMFLAHRRGQFRNRRSGRTIAATPAHLVATEATLRSTGSAGGDSARFLDRALRDLSGRLARTGGALPDVAAVRLAEDRLDLLFTSPPAGQPPAPWTDDGQGERWTLARESPLEESDALAPYPALVAIGTANDGATWLLDLEAPGLVQLRGDRAVCEDLARFIGAELAVNVWSDDVAVTLAGFGHELVGLNPTRLRHQEVPDVTDLVKTARRVHEASDSMGYDVLAGRRDGHGADTWMPTIAVANADADADADAGQIRDDVERLLDELAVRPGRHAVALVTIGDPRASGGMTLTLDVGGRCTLMPSGTDLTVNQLTAMDAQTLADLLAASDRADDEPMPPATGPQPFEEVSDAAGALRVELTEPRDGGAAPDSLLALPDQTYVTSAATTVADLAALAPVVSAAAGTRIMALDRSLDDDLAAWSDPETPRPRLRLLGPIEVRASGERTADVDRRCAYFTEVVAYLAARDHGATPEQVADAFNVQTNTIHSRVGTIRKWLGADPSTGEWYLPESTRSPSAKTRGVAVYEVVGLLSDADLFRRVRVRGQARGTEGIDDLTAALRLVEGRPFDQLRPGGYGWLAETPLDQYLTAGIVDVAHIVATHALSTGDHELAHWASEIAIAAAPSEDKPRLDLARALSAMGHCAEADHYVAAEIHNRSDDGGSPPSPTGRTSEVEAPGRTRHRLADPDTG